MAGFVYVIYNDFSSANEPDETEEPMETEEVEDSEEEEPVLLDGPRDDELNPFNTKIKQEEMTESTIRDYIHKMSHQKIHAEEKWGLIEITAERVEWLLESVDKTKEQIEHKDVYTKILTRWADGDFSQAVEDHNTIWTMQGGNIGKALRLLTEDEEAAYLESKR